MTESGALDSGPVIDPETSRAYEAFVRQPSSGAEDPYYAEERVRFEIEADDVLVTPGPLRVTPVSCGVRFESDRLRIGVEACGVSLRDAGALASAIDGARRAHEIRSASGVDEKTWERFTSKTFGAIVFAPAAVEGLERRVSGIEIVRYPGSPYEIVRAYWRNMGTVSERLAALPKVLESTPDFVRCVRELHAAALVGDGASFYRPASRIAGAGDVRPGTFFVSAAKTRKTDGGVRFLSGVRVNASPIGGEHHQRILAERTEDPESLEPARDFADEGVSWGRIVTARAFDDDAEKPWFCPPRPIESAHFDFLRRSLRAALDASGRDPDAFVTALAAFHQSFVRLHPFRCGNQSIAMSFVNHALRSVRGAGIPHLVLDHFALRLSRRAYARAFRTALDAWFHAGGAVERYTELAGRKRRVYAFIRALSAAPSLDEARSLVDARPADARLAMLG